MNESGFSNTRLVTPKTIYNTILYDVPTRIWFKIICFLPDIESQLKKSNTETALHYREYRRFSILGRIFLGLALMLAVTGVIFLEPTDIFLAVALLTLGISLAAFFQRRRHIAHIGAQFVSLNLETLPSEATLYEMSEVHSKKYSIHSIVDITAAMDSWVQNIFLVIVSVCLFLYFLPFDQILFIVFSVLLIAYPVINSGILFRSKPKTSKPSFPR